MVSGSNSSSATYLALLKQGAAEWNLWRASHPQLAIDLQGADLRGLNLVAANLSGINLTDADLSGANLNAADLQDSVLVGVTGIQTSLMGACLDRANLLGSCLLRANLMRARLRRSNLGRARLRGANMASCQLGQAVLIRADLSGVDLSDAIATGARSHRDSHATLQSKSARGQPTMPTTPFHRLTTTQADEVVAAEAAEARTSEGLG